MPERDCGCVWRVIPRSEVSSRFRHRVSGTAVRFTHRCTAHASMCRSLEPWEVGVTGPGMALIRPLGDQAEESVPEDTKTPERRT